MRKNSCLLQIELYFSIPVPALTEHVQVAWPPLPASGGQVPTFKINSRPSVEIDYNVERIRFVKFLSKDRSYSMIHILFALNLWLSKKTTIKA